MAVRRTSSAGVTPGPRRCSAPALTPSWSSSSTRRIDISNERNNVMRTIEAVRRSGVGIGPERTIRDAALVMQETGIGALAVIDGEHLVGIVTDRDLVRRGLARDLPADARVDAVMSSPVIAIDADADLHDTFALFRTHAVRRL